jgi:hypothetical protein
VSWVEARQLDIYTLYIEDDRYSVPTIDILTAETDEAARALAAQRLGSSPHYRSVEVWADDRYVWRTPNGERTQPPAMSD